MINNPIIETMLSHKSIRKYTLEQPSQEVIETIVRAGQQAPFASQLYSIVMSRQLEKNPFKAPLSFMVCIDAFRLELFMKKRNWEMAGNDLLFLLLAVQDASLVVQNMITAGESLGLGSCLLGSVPYRAEQISKRMSLPKRVFPLVELVMGYPAEEASPRPRFPLDFVLFEDKYPEFTDEQIEEAMRVMDEGYLAQDYYKNANAKIRLQGDKEDDYTYDNYSWTEHISRKWGQYFPWPKGLEDLLKQLKSQGFNISDTKHNGRDN